MVEGNKPVKRAKVVELTSHKIISLSPAFAGSELFVTPLPGAHAPGFMLFDRFAGLG